MNIVREGTVIGEILRRAGTDSDLFVVFFGGEEVTEIQLRALFGTATIEILEMVEGSGCYQKVQSCLISGWELFV